MIVGYSVSQFLLDRLDGEGRQSCEHPRLQPAVKLLSHGSREHFDPLSGDDVGGEFLGTFSTVRDHLLIFRRVRLESPDSIQHFNRSVHLDIVKR